MTSILYYHYKQLLSLKGEITDDGDVTMKPFPMESNENELINFISDAIGNDFDKEKKDEKREK